MTLTDFRAETRAWLEENCPDGARGPGEMATGSTRRKIQQPETKVWLDRMAAKGWTAPTWPAEYGGGGLSRDESIVLAEEMGRIRARPPLVGMGLSMIGPTLLEYGTDDQKARHLPKIIRGELAWCQGYSEPGAGSDLAGLQTRAVDNGDHYVINGQKIWTSGAQFADWMFILVRTDPDVPKHEGISFMLLPMDQPGITVKPIRLISGSSPFCETFFDDAIAQKTDLVGNLNRGWAVGKRLLQHERSGQGGLGAGGGRRPAATPSQGLVKLARTYLGLADDAAIPDPAIRDRITGFNMDQRIFSLTQKRAREENQSGKTIGDSTSIFKLFGATMGRDLADFRTQLMGSQGYGAGGDTFSDVELEATANFLSSRAHTIYGGTNEVQLNIIAKRVLGLPD